MVTKKDKVKCNYNQCRKKRKLFKCVHCENYYCKEHLKPKNPGFIHEHTLYLLYRPELRQIKDGHPCSKFFEHSLEKRKIDKEIYQQVLENLTKKQTFKKDSKLEKIKKTTIDITRLPPISFDKIIPKEEVVIKPTKEEVIIEPQENKSKISIWDILIILSIITVIGIFYYDTHNYIDETPLINNQQIEEQQPIEKIIVKISFDKYIKDYLFYENKNISLNGYLEKHIIGNNNVGVYVHYIVDDFNNKIKLTGLSNEQKVLFEGTTKELYKVTGVFKMKFQVQEIVIISIT